MTPEEQDYVITRLVDYAYKDPAIRDKLADLILDSMTKLDPTSEGYANLKMLLEQVRQLCGGKS